MPPPYYAAGMTVDQFVSLHPTLYHMADARNRDGVRAAGLLSTAALLDRYGVTGADRAAVEGQHRPATVRIPFGPRHPTLGYAFVRDQRPIAPAALAPCLADGLSPSQWYRMLNGRVYLWPVRDRLDRMLRTYADAPQLVLEVDAAALLARHGERVELSHINSGFTARQWRPIRRGLSTFVPLARYAWSRANAVAEVTVPYAVPDVLACLRSATLVDGGRAERLDAL